MLSVKLSRISLRLWRIALISLSLIIVLLILAYEKRQQQQQDAPNYARVVRNFEASTPIPNLHNKNIFYNRIEKCGSRSLISVIMNLRKQNNVTVFSDNTQYEVFVEGEDLFQLQQRITSFPSLTFYERHVYYVDFSLYPLTKPIYINMLREPIDRFISHYNYDKYGDMGSDNPAPKPDRGDINDCVMQEIERCSRQDSLMFNIGIYFCGMAKECQNVTRERVEIAKKNIDEQYAMIGMMEEFEKTLLLLEWMMPDYFRGALAIWKEHHETLDETASLKGDVLNEQMRKKLREDVMADEYEVYNYAVAKYRRLKKQYGIE